MTISETKRTVERGYPEEKGRENDRVTIHIQRNREMTKKGVIQHQGSPDSPSHSNIHHGKSQPTTKDLSLSTLANSKASSRVLFYWTTISVINKSKSTTKLNERSFSISLKISKEDHIWQVNFPTSEFNLEAGDEVEVIADFGYEIHVKKIGVCLIYGRVIDGKMIHYPSTSNEDAIVVSDDGDASIYISSSNQV
ncbi:hypothetical protein FH972_024770 [Carpinus fangiana]|uniref:Uncharacterized protein n=1 Tax=Carpinus fangiana TaxID=176857 RepID=A0A5N6KZV0_9ROSI|nr:hypothetical protein FH972_024770 [Carpinus fangiana]